MCGRSVPDSSEFSNHCFIAWPSHLWDRNDCQIIPFGLGTALEHLCVSLRFQWTNWAGGNQREWHEPPAILLSHHLHFSHYCLWNRSERRIEFDFVKLLAWHLRFMFTTTQCAKHQSMHRKWHVVKWQLMETKRLLPLNAHKPSKYRLNLCLPCVNVHARTRISENGA